MRIHDRIPEITTTRGRKMKPVFSGRLNGKEFCPSLTVTAAIAEARKRGLRYRVVNVLAKELRGKLDIHHRPYTPIRYVLVECPPDAP